jgi:putative copper export protein
MDGWDWIRVVHLLAMAFFVGGQLVLVAAIVPVLRGHEHMRLVARRFGGGSLVAIAVAIATGIPMASHYGRWDDPTLHAKLGLLVLAGALIGAHMARPRWRALDGAVFLLSLAIVALGVALAHG